MVHSYSFSSSVVGPALLLSPVLTQGDQTRLKLVQRASKGSDCGLREALAHSHPGGRRLYRTQFSEVGGQVWDQTDFELGL